MQLGRTYIHSIYKAYILSTQKNFKKKKNNYFKKKYAMLESHENLLKHH